MGKIIRAVRLRAPHKRKTNIYKIGDICLPKHKQELEATIKDIIHEPGRAAPVAILAIQEESKIQEYYIAAVEGIHQGMKIQIGEQVPLEIGNCMKIKYIPEGTCITMVEKLPYDGGRFAKSCGSFAILTYHNKEKNTSTLALNSGVKITVSSDVRGVIGIIAGGGKNDKPLLKAGNAYYRYKYNLRAWPRVRGVAMNPVDHPHGGGNHQHIGKPSTISRHAPPNKAVGLIAARRTGRKRTRASAK